MMTATQNQLQQTIERMAEIKGRLERTPKTETRYNDYLIAFNQLSEQLHQLGHQD